MKIKKILVYADAKYADADALARRLQDIFCVPARAKDSLMRTAPSSIVRDISSCRIRDVAVPGGTGISGGTETLGDPLIHKGMALYDGFAVQRVLGGLVPRGEAGTETLNIILSDMLLCTFDTADMRYHARSVICSNPAIISVSGIIEAPARPRGYYVAAALADARRPGAKDLLAEYDGQYIMEGDARLGCVIEGYAIQAVFYYFTGEAFCTDPDCRLYNAHWQSELVRLQITSRRLCKRHAAVLEGTRSGDSP